MKIQNKVIVTLAVLLFFATVKAQNKFDVKVQIQSMHYWRGLRVGNGLTTATSIGYFGKNFSAYSWGGLSINGDYKEVTNVLSYNKNNFTATMIDIFNFSGVNNIKYFNYDKGKTIHLMDLELAYSFSFMNVSWATIFYGNDLVYNGDQRYSTYVDFEFPIKVKDVTITPYIAPAFALNGKAKAMLYGDDNFGIANVGFKVAKTLKFAEKKFPVSATLGFNTILNQASVEVNVDLF